MKRFYDVLSMILTRLCVGLLVIYTALVAVQVISRYVFNSPTTWTELVARYLFVWSIMLYMPVLYRNRGNAAFDLVLTKLNPVARHYTQLAIDAVIAACAYCLTRWGFVFCSKMGNKYVVGLGIEWKIPMNLVYSAIPVGAAILALMCIEQLAIGLRGLGKEGK